MNRFSRFGERFAAAALGLAAAAGCSSDPKPPDAPAVESEFWSERESTYRSDPRGPFTAIRAQYLALGDSVSLFASEDSVSAVPGGTVAVTVRYEDNWGFTIRPVVGWEPPTLDGEPLDGSYQTGDGAGVRLGRYLLSFGELAPNLGRVLVYDPHLLGTRFHGFPVFPESDDLRLEAKVTPAGRDTVTLGTTRGLEKEYVRVAFLDFEVGGTPCRLTGFLPPHKKLEPLFVPFQDETSGGESYGVGRYLRVEQSPTLGPVVIDFNRATNPWCAYSPFYNCVLPPEENRLAVAIRAGERTPEGH
jgi:hypothetical protein